MIQNCSYDVFLPCARFRDGLTLQTLISLKKTAPKAAKTGKFGLIWPIFDQFLAI